MEAVTFVGTVAGSNIGIFDGYGTFNSSLGSFRQHVMGPANFSDRTCAGHVTYRVWIALPNGDGPELPMLDIDFVTVNGGFEILGTPNATAGVTGAGVPRLTCRLVRTQGQD